MKKILLLLIVGLFSLGLVACGSNMDSTTGTEEPKEDPKPSEQKEVSNEVVEDEETTQEEMPEVKKDENGNYILDTVGQKVTVDTSGTAELLKIKEINETVDLSPLKVTVNNMKLIKMTELNSDFAEMLELNTEETIDDNFTYLQISFTAENTEEKNVDWFDLETLVLSNGQQIDANFKDFIFDDGDGDYTFFGKVVKEFTTAVIVKDEDISKVKMIFSPTSDTDNFEELAAQQQVEYEF